MSRLCACVIVFVRLFRVFFILLFRGDTQALVDVYVLEKETCRDGKRGERMKKREKETGLRKKGRDKERESSIKSESFAVIKKETGKGRRNERKTQNNKAER